MKNLFKKKKKLILLSVFLLVFITGCKVYVDPTTKKVMEEYIIYSTTSFGEVFNEGWFAAIFVWPLAQFINFLGSFSDAGIAILLATILINTVIGAFSIKSQVQNQQMQMIQPELQKIQKKYEGKTDDNSKMRQAQEMQALYSKYGINPFSSMLTMFIQLPVMMAFYYAVQRAAVVVNGTFLGIDLTQTPKDGLGELNWIYIIIWVAMIALQYISMKVPTWLAKKNKENSGVKTKDYAQPKQSGFDQMFIMSIFSTAMIGFIGFTWPVAMSYYWGVSSLVRIIQSVVIDKFFMKK